MGVAGAIVKNHFQSKKCLPELFSSYKKAKNQHPSMILKSDQIWSALLTIYMKVFGRQNTRNVFKLQYIYIHAHAISSALKNICVGPKHKIFDFITDSFKLNYPFKMSMLLSNAPKVLFTS